MRRGYGPSTGLGICWIFERGQKLHFKAQHRLSRISSGKILSGKQCSKKLWLELSQPDVAVSLLEQLEPKVEPDVRSVLEALHDPEARWTRADDGCGAVKLTEELLRTRQPMLQARFSADGVVASADILKPIGTRGRKGWRMIDVKQSTSIKAHHLDRAAVQYFVARAAGIDVRSCFLARINPAFIYGGDGDYEGLFVEEDVTEAVSSRTDEVRTWIAEAKRVRQRSREPKASTGAHCWDPYPCGFHDYCSAQEPAIDYPLDWLPRLQSKRVKALIETKGLRDLRDVPDDHLNPTQLRVKRCSLSGETYFDIKGARAALRRHALPAYFLDFEAVSFAVPIWKDTRPYQQISFQFSLHRRRRGGAIDHHAFLDLTGEDPSRRLAEQLVELCGEVGPIFVYNAAFETGRLKELEARFPRLSPKLRAIRERLVDLHPIAVAHYYHPAQEGSWSIKALLPTIAPDLDHAHLAGVKDGNMAVLAYKEAIHPSTSPVRRAEIERQLLDYCHLDTLALVRIWEMFSGR